MAITPIEYTTDYLYNLKSIEKINEISGVTNELKENVDGLIGGSSGFDEKITSDIFSSSQSEIKYISLPSPYDAVTFSDLSQRVQDQLTLDGQVAAWEGMSSSDKKVCLHPSLVYTPKGFGGFKYWCAYTPYPSSNSKFENPCISASYDGYNWLVPNGLENPIEPAPSGSSYNRDTHLYYDNRSNQLVLIWLTRTNISNILYCKTSKDGVLWTDKLELWSGVRNVSDFASPSIYYSDYINKWVMYGHNLDSSGREIIRKTSDSLLVDWGDSSDITCSAPENAGFKWWHSQFSETRSGGIVALVQENTSAGGSGLIHSLYSVDGVSFRKSENPFVNVRGLYRPTFCKSDAGIDIMIGMLNNPKLLHLSGCFNGFGELHNLAIKGKGSDIASDDFLRANAAQLGTSSSGDVWVQYSGTNYISIVNNAATAATTGNCKATLDSGTENYAVTTKARSIGSSAEIVFRFVDNNNFYRFRLVQGSVEKISGGLVTQSYTSNVNSNINGIKVTIVNADKQVKIFLNDSIAHEIPITGGDNSSLCGLQISGAVNSEFEYFVISDL